MLSHVFRVTAFWAAGTASALACSGSGMGEIRPGDKVVGIQIKKTRGFGVVDPNAKSEWAMDDDGIMALSFAASHCYIDIENPRVVLNDEQYKCMSDAQSDAGLSQENRITFHYYIPKMETKTTAIEAVKAKCNLDAIAMWSEVLALADEKSLSCVQDVRGLVKKAVARNAEYVREQTNPLYLAGMNLTAQQIDEHVKILREEQAHVGKLVEMFNSTPVKTGDFKKWAVEFKPFVGHHSYQLADSPDDPFDPNKSTELMTVLSRLNSNLPFDFGPRAKCAGGFPSDIVAKLKDAIWEPRASGPGTQGGNKNGTQNGTRVKK